MKEKAVAIGMFLAAGLAIHQLSPRHSSPPAVVQPQSPKPIDQHARLMATVTGESRYAAQEIVGKRLKAPSQAEFVEAEVMDTLENYALVYLVVDAPNSFGVKLRAGYCVVLWYQLPDGKNFLWNKQTSVVTCDDKPDVDAIYALKLVNGWPNLGPAPASFTAAVEKPRHRRR